MNRGEVWLISLPAVGGREQAGQRPAIVLQSQRYGQSSPLVVVVPLTTQMDATRFAGTVPIDADSTNGLSKRSVAMVFQVRAVDRTRFRTRLGVISPADLERVFAEMDRLFERK